MLHTKQFYAYTGKINERKQAIPNADSSGNPIRASTVVANNLTNT